MLVPLLQISIALGILYVGLQAARYRNRIYEGVVSAILAQTEALDADDLAALGYKDRLSQDSKLSTAHHRVSMWLGELPRAYSEQLKDTVADSFSDSRRKDGAPCVYRWFKSNADRFWVFLLSSIVPILLTWELAFPFAGLAHSQMFNYALFGQGFVAAHVAVGWSMSLYFRWRFRAQLQMIVRQVASSRYRGQMQSFHIVDLSGPPPD